MKPNYLISRFAGEPALIEPGCEVRFKACLEQAEAAELPALASTEDFWSEDYAWVRPYEVSADGILSIPVRGVLLHDFPYQLFSWATGYTYLQKAFERGMADANVRAVAFVIDSPGGMVAGCFDAVDKMVAAKTKPVRAFAHEAAYSAAYAIASVADHIAISRTGGVGSVGVVTMHVDLSRAMEERGITITYVHAGKHKVDGNPHEPLADDVKARIQTRIDELYEVFVACVSRGRGLDVQVVRDTEALTFTATQAVANGFADSIGSLDDTFAAFAASLDDPSDNPGEDPMAEKTQPIESAVDQAAHEQAVGAARAEGYTEGAAAERELIFAILDSDEAATRPAAARALAAEGGRTLEAATAFLSKLPAEGKSNTHSGGQTFAEAMEHGNPELGAEGSEDASAQDDEDDSTSVRDLAKQMGLKGFA
ncbi:S49 family peptidase [Novosphingobium sp. YJ-S2-02]|uniref:S49 family peptidase n=1 Tax=Novosphingobium aureum TaxID=2792964 RepID=A0A931MKX1_9SPHN|nr:S49 family peptidase [Novosphingobium aureum]MBH0113273.1 S49 family peptidase [Novosphingobium aureum]